MNLKKIPSSNFINTLQLGYHNMRTSNLFLSLNSGRRFGCVTLRKEGFGDDGGGGGGAPSHRDHEPRLKRTIYTIRSKVRAVVVVVEAMVGLMGVMGEGVQLAGATCERRREAEEELRRAFDRENCHYVELPPR